DEPVTRGAFVVVVKREQPQAGGRGSPRVEARAVLFAAGGNRNGCAVVEARGEPRILSADRPQADLAAGLGGERRAFEARAARAFAGEPAEEVLPEDFRTAFLAG